MARDETPKYTDLMPDGTARMFTFVMEAKSLATYPAGGHKLKPGFREITSLAWSSAGESVSAGCTPAPHLSIQRRVFRRHGPPRFPRVCSVHCEQPRVELRQRANFGSQGR